MKFFFKETFQIHSKIQENVKFLYFSLFRTVYSVCQTVSNETSFLSYFMRYTRKWSFSVKESFLIHSKILENVIFLYFSLYRTVYSICQSVSNETSFLSYFMRYRRKWSFSLKESNQIHYKLQENVKLLYFILFRTVYSNFQSV